MEKLRKPFQGIINIVKFNWHFYLLSIIFTSILLCIYLNVSTKFNIYFLLSSTLLLISTIISLLVSYFVYDISSLYKFEWLEANHEKIKIVNINAGFDETSYFLQSKFTNSELIVLDFYNPKRHTEVSIKRARKAFPPYPNTIETQTSILPLNDISVDKIVLFFAAHEIRNENERIIFFKEINRILKPEGQIFITEHLRDCYNFLAYNIGFFHFLSKSCWYRTFEGANLKIKAELKFTPFITNFILEKHAITT